MARRERDILEHAVTRLGPSSPSRRSAYDRLGERKRFGATGSWSQQNCDAL
jgi:hypothetical protein